MANYGKRMVSEDQIKKLENLADIREAGENITIVNGVISAAGGGSEKKYNHAIDFRSPDSSNYRVYISLNIVKDNNTPITLKEFLDLLYNNPTVYLSCVGGSKDGSNFKIVNMIYYSSYSSKFSCVTITDTGSQGSIQLGITRDAEGNYTGTNLQLIDNILEMTI